MPSVSQMVSWTDVLAYVTEARERALLELADAEDTRTIGKAQGKLDLCNELLNLRSIFDTITQAQEAAAPKLPDARTLSREVYRAQLQRGPNAPTT